MYKLLIPIAFLFASNANAQSIVSLEDQTAHTINISIIKADTAKIDAISISATYYGNETDNAVNFIPLWNKKYKTEQSTTKLDASSFDMTKPFKVILRSKGRVVKTFEMSRRTEINGLVLSNYEVI